MANVYYLIHYETCNFFNHFNHSSLISLTPLSTTPSNQTWLIKHLLNSILIALISPLKTMNSVFQMIIPLLSVKPSDEPLLIEMMRERIVYYVMIGVKNGFLDSFGISWDSVFKWFNVESNDDGMCI